MTKVSKNYFQFSISSLDEIDLYKIHGLQNDIFVYTGCIIINGQSEEGLLGTLTQELRYREQMSLQFFEKPTDLANIRHNI